MHTLPRFGAFVMSAVVLSAAAHAQPAAEKPKFNVGDRWEFRQSTADGETTTWSREIVEIPSEAQLRVRLGSGKVDEYDGAMNFMPEGNPERARPLVRYPLKVGDAWSFSRKFPNPGTGEEGKVRVVALESLTVPAGTFQCYRIEAESSLTNKAYKELRSWIRWYCPDVKWIAKEVLDTRTTGRDAQNSAVLETSELLGFTAGK